MVVKNSTGVTRHLKWSSSTDVEAGLPPNGSFRFPNPLAAERVPVYYSSSIHPWMKGYARVFDHPYYAVTDGDGKFEIKDAPAGTFRMVVWHEKVGYLRGKEGRAGGPVRFVPDKNGSVILAPTVFDVTK